MTRLQRMRSDDGGWAMVMVLATMTVLSLLVALALGSASRSLKTSRYGQDSYAALAAAQAGVQHYLEQLNRNGAYYPLSTPTAPPSSDPGGLDGANAALRTNAAVQPPAARTTRVSPTGEQSFRYQVLSTAAQVASTGRIVLRSVGRSRAVERSVQVSLSNESIFKYLYYTEFETPPPLVAGRDPVACTALSHTQHGQTTARSTTSCQEVSFRGDATVQDEIHGPLHTEDRITINGSPKFFGPVETGWLDPAGTGWVQASTATSATPVFNAGGASLPNNGLPVHADFPFPRYNRDLRLQAASGNGCLYTGPTRILYQANGTMTVTSPYTTSGPAACGTFSPANSYTSTVAVPSNGVVWVDKSTSTTCTLQEQRDRIKFPVPGDTALVGGASPLFHDCTAGTVYVEGWVKGQTTLAAEDNVFVTGNLRYAAGVGAPIAGSAAAIAADTAGTDVLGLYTNSGFVAVYHPATCADADRDTSTYGNGMCRNFTGSEITRAAEASGTTTGPSQPTAYPMTTLQIDAAIITPQAFLVANHDIGATAQTGTRTLHLVGSVAQRFRGAVFISNASAGVRGFKKDYRYDPRLKLAPPPHLADVTASAWGVASFAETG